MSYLIFKDKNVPTGTVKKSERCASGVHGYEVSGSGIVEFYFSNNPDADPNVDADWMLFMAIDGGSAERGISVEHSWRHIRYKVLSGAPSIFVQSGCAT